jgi:hypothetical protein
MCNGIEHKEGYLIIDKRTENGKEFAEIRDESLNLVEDTILFAVLFDANRTSCKGPGKLIERFKREKKYKHLNELDLKNNMHKNINYIGK